MPQQRTNKHTSRNSSNKGINYTRTVLDVEEKNDIFARLSTIGRHESPTVPFHWPMGSDISHTANNYLSSRDTAQAGHCALILQDHLSLAVENAICSELFSYFFTPRLYNDVSSRLESHLQSSRSLFDIRDIPVGSVRKL